MKLPLGWDWLARLGVVGVCGAVASGQPTPMARAVVLIAKFANETERERALDELIGLGTAAVPVLVGRLDALRAQPPAEDTAATIEGILRACAALGDDAAAAAPALSRLIDEPTQTRHWELASWAYGEATRHRAAPCELTDRAQPADTHLIAVAKLRLGAAPSPDEVLRWLTTDENDHGQGYLSWAAPAAAAAWVSRLRASSPDLETALLARFHALHARRHDLQHYENWCLAELATGVRALPLSPADELAAEIARLQHPDPRQRRLAAVALRRFGAELAAHLHDLAARLGDSEQDVVRETLTTLSMLGPSAAVLLPAAREAAAGTRPDLERVARAALDRLVQSIDREKERAGASVGAALAYLHEPAERRRALKLPVSREVAAILAPALLVDAPDDAGALHEDILALLTSFGPIAADQVPALLVFLPRASPEACEATLAALAAIGPAARRHPDLARRLAQAIGTCAAPPLRVWSETCAAIFTASEREPNLVRFLTDSNPVLRLRAVEALGRLGASTPATLAALAHAVEAAHPDVITLATSRGQLVQVSAAMGEDIALAAARVLLATPTEHAGVAVARLLTSDADDDCLLALDRCARDGAPRHSLAAVAACLRSPKDAVALAAIAALARAGADARPHLAALQDLAAGGGDVARAAGAAIAQIVGK